MVGLKYTPNFGREYARVRDKVLDQLELIKKYYYDAALVTKAADGHMLVDYQGEVHELSGESFCEGMAKLAQWPEAATPAFPLLPVSIHEDSPGMALQEEAAQGFLLVRSEPPQAGGNPWLSLEEGLKLADKESVPASQLLPDGLLMLDNSGKECYRNFIADYMLRRGSLALIDAGNVDITSAAIPAAEITAEVLYPKLDGFDVLVLKIPLCAGAGRQGTLVIMADISMQKRSEKELIEKSTVIREIHHRVKNNLQTITSLLRLQIRRSNQRILEKSFNESINRILSIALIHEALSRQDIEVINVKQTSYNILQTILSNMVDPGKVISGNVSGDDVFLPSETASSICLCITELIQNALEHAFIGRDDGNIRIDFSDVDGTITIKVADNGTGIKKQPEKSLGMEIVNTIVGRKLRGTFALDSNRYGTTACIEFQNDARYFAE